MNIWTRRILGVLPVVGCGAGVVALALSWEESPRDAAMIATLTAFALVYLFGAVAGLMLLEGRRRAIAANFGYWLIQTLQFSSFPLTYGFWAPLSLVAWWNHGEAGAFTAEVGSNFHLSAMNAGVEAAIGLNLFAVFCCAALWIDHRRGRKAPVTDIDDEAIRAALAAEKQGFGRWPLPQAYQPGSAPPISAS